MATTSVYYLVDLTKQQFGWGPDLPVGIGFVELAIPDSGADYPPAFALYALRPSARDRVNPDVAQPVPASLKDLLDAAHDYPPALALMRDEVQDRGVDFRPTFLALVAQRLQAHLDRQGLAPYLQASAQEVETGYKSVGKSYWIVNYHPAQGKRGAQVSWVSADFFVYRDPASHFAVDEADLISRFPPRPLRPELRVQRLPR